MKTRVLLIPSDINGHPATAAVFNPLTRILCKGEGAAKKRNQIITGDA